MIITQSTDNNNVIIVFSPVSVTRNNQSLITMKSHGLGGKKGTCKLCRQRIELIELRKTPVGVSTICVLHCVGSEYTITIY